MTLSNAMWDTILILLGKHLYFLGEHFLIIRTGAHTMQRLLSGAVQQLKLLHGVSTSHFLRSRVDGSPYFIWPKAKNKMILA